MLKLIKHILIWTAILSYLIVVLSFVNIQRKHLICSEVMINITDSNINRFITQQDINILLEKNNQKILGYPLNEINTNKIEELIRILPPALSAEAYHSNDGVLFIDIQQRKPVIRIINQNRQGYYIDYDGKILPLSPHYSSHILVANGYIHEPFKIINNTSVNLINSTNKRNVIQELYLIAKYVYNDSFLRNQFEQIYVNENQEFEIIPRVGSHVILLGTAENFEYKFTKLKIFYLNGLNNIGWNQYKTINLNYSNQVVCTKN